MTEERTPENGWQTSEENCPHCGVSLQGDAIPEKYFVHEPGCNGLIYRCKRRHTAFHDDGRCHALFFGAECGEVLTQQPCFCFPYGKVTHFSRKIGVEVPGVYDGVLYWQCPDCGWRWHRWTNMPSMMAKAEPYVSGAKR